MKKELQDNLYRDFPEIFAQRTWPMDRTCMCWGIDCDDGWYNIIEALCYKIAERVKVVDYYCSVQARQVKEKYGTLRFYLSTSDDEIDEFVRIAEDLSAKTCEVTGKPGTLCSTSGDWRGWLKTLCPEQADLLGYKPIEETNLDVEQTEV